MDRAIRAWSKVLLLVALAGCSGNTCSGLQPLPAGFPPEERVPMTVQVRLSDFGLTELERRAPELVKAIFKGGLNFQVPSNCGGDPRVCCGRNCGLVFDVNNRAGEPSKVEVNPVSDQRLDLILRPRVRTSPAIKVDKKVLFFTVSCNVNLNTERSGAPWLTIRSYLEFVEDDVAGTARGIVGPVSIQGLDNGDVTFTGNFACRLVDFFKGRIIADVKRNMENQIGRAVRDLMCKKCSDDSQCAPFGSCDNGVCQVFGKDRCLQELGTSGRLDTTTFATSVSAGPRGAFDLYSVAGGGMTMLEGGVSMPMLSAAITANRYRSACVPPVGPPTRADIRESSMFRANEFKGHGFDLGIAMHKFFLDQVGHSAYDSGLLCMSLGTREVELLNSATLQLLAPSMTDLVWGGENAEVVLALRPKRPPTFKLGLGTFTPAGEIDNPLLTMDMPELDIDVYIHSDDRYVRIMTMESDLVLPMGFDVGPNGEVEPVLGDVGRAFTNLRVKNSKLLAEKPAEIVAKFPAMLSLAAPFLGDKLGKLTVPALAGFTMRPLDGGITSIDNFEFLAVYGRLTPLSKPERVDTFAEVAAVRAPGAEAFRAPSGAPPEVELILSGQGPDGTDRDLEWQVRVDDGFWSPFSRDRRRILSRQAFWVQGRHKIDVRARQVGDSATVDEEPYTVEALIDREPPAIALEKRGEWVRVVPRDAVARRDELEVSYRFDDGRWVAADGDIDLNGREPASLEIRVTDPAGNEALARGDQARELPVDDPAMGCDVGAGGRTGGAAALLLVLLLPRAARLRRRAGTVAALLLAGQLGAGCTCSGKILDENSGPPSTKRELIIGRWSDMVVAGDRLIVSTYEAQYGDLLLIESSDVENLGQRIRVIDGVPDGPVLDDGPSHRGRVSALGEDMGAYSSIAVHDGQVRVAYQDVDRGMLRFAAEDPDGWTRHEVDPGDGGRAGLYNSLSLDAQGVPGIAYMVHGLEDPGGGRRSELRWAQATTPFPTNAGDWVVETVVAAPISCAGLCGTGQVCVTATGICRTVDTTAGEACAMCAGDKACVAGVCEPISRPPGYTTLPHGVGLFASAARLADGRPVIAFYDGTTGDLGLAVRDAAGGWTATPLDGGGDRGHFASLVVGPDDTVHIAYQDAWADQLLYVSWSNGSVGPVEVVDSGERDEGLHTVGASSTVFFDAGGNLTIAYQDQTDVTLLFARKTESGWSRGEVLGGKKGAGFFVSAGVRDGQTLLSNYVYDRGFYPPGGLEIVPLP